MTKMRLGFIGLGNMGFPMANRLLRQSYEIALFDIREAALEPFRGPNALIARSPREVADRADVVFASLPTPEVVREAALGTDGLIRGHRMRAYIDLSTNGPDMAVQVGEALLNKGVEVLDCPVSGGVPGAEKGTLSLMAAGKKSTYDRYYPLLEHLGTKIFHIGEAIGQAQVMKVINNLLSASALAMTSEAVVLGCKAGLDPTVMIDILNASSGRNSATEDKFYNFILPRKFDYGFSMQLAYKDIKLCLDIAENLKVPMFIGSNMVHFWRYIVSQSGEGEKDYTNVIRQLEKWANVEVSGSQVVS